LDPGAEPGISTKQAHKCLFGGDELGSTTTVKIVFLLGMIPPGAFLDSNRSNFIDANDNVALVAANDNFVVGADRIAA
jgi:hypothetical protein